MHVIIFLLYFYFSYHRKNIVGFMANINDSCLYLSHDWYLRTNHDIDCVILLHSTHGCYNIVHDISNISQNILEENGETSGRTEQEGEINFYTITWLLSAFLLVCSPWSIRRHTHRWRQIHVRSRQRTCFAFF